VRPAQRLLARAAAHAVEDYQRREAELRELGPALAHLDEFVPALAARGLEIGISDYSLKLEHYYPSGSILGRKLKVVRLHTRGIVTSDARVAKWITALEELGFKEIERSTGSYPTVLLRKGPLLVRVDAPVALPAPGGAA
jgi:hypothetical protein